MNIANKNVMLWGPTNSGKTTRLKQLILKILQSNKKNIKIKFIHLPRMSQKVIKKNVLYSYSSFNKIISILLKDINAPQLNQLDYVAVIYIDKNVVGIGTRGDTENIFNSDYEKLMKENCTMIIMPCNLKILIEGKGFIKTVMKDINTVIYGIGHKTQNTKIVDKLYSEI